MTNREKETRFHWSRRHVNENVGLIFTGIATIAAALAWNEARLTRKDAHDEAERSFAIQSSSLNSQMKQFNQSVELQKQAATERKLEVDRSYGLQQESLEAQIHTLQMEQRPFIRAVGEVRKLELNESPHNIPSYGLSVEFKISGNTPAVNVRIVSDAREFRRCKMLHYHPQK
jgi:hypothetical protein